MNEESKGSQGPIRATKGGTILFVVQARRSMCVYVSLCVWFKVRVKKKNILAVEYRLLFPRWLSS